MKRLKYVLVLLLGIGLLVVPLLLLVLDAFLLSTHSIKDPLIIGIAAAAVILFIAWFATKDLLRKVRVGARRDVEYDEYGNSKTKGNYEYLSKQERNAIDLQRTANMEQIVSTSELKKMSKQGALKPEEEMNKLIGLAPVKEKITEMVARIKFEKETKTKKEILQDKQDSCRHMVFFGNPGTGKTTVARIMTGFFYQYGYIEKNKCIEIDGNFLKSGENTAMKTELVIRQAFGGVLFIDEAYALTSSYSGLEAIATLIKQMEDNRGKFILILAGYTKEMRDLLNANPGFMSRIKEYITFPDYSDDEMAQIFEFMAKEKGFEISSDAYEPFMQRVDNEKMYDSFGNARTVRNILDDAIDKHSLNYMEKKIPKEHIKTLEGIDISTIPRNIGIVEA